ncbi:MAG: replication initiator protein A [Lachnospiraceae bacterium]|nr:replication initiator protein A [Lachnospiraceae bacterium]
MAKFEYDYYSGERSGQFRFLKVPKEFFEDDDYDELGLYESVLYGFLLEHIDYSRNNGWIDAQGRTYIILSMDAIRKILKKCSEDKARATLNNLIEYGLIEKKRRGQGKPDLIYVKDFVTKKTENSGSEKTHESSAHISEPEKNGFLNPEKPVSRNGKYPVLEPGKTAAKETNTIETIYTETPSVYPDTVDTKGSSRFSEDDGLKDEEQRVNEYEEYARIIRENIDYDNKINELKSDDQRCRLFDDFYSLIVDVVTGSEEEYRINKSFINARTVKSRMLKLTGDQVLKAIEQYLSATERIFSIRNYIISVLYNASFITRAIKSSDVEDPSAQQANSCRDRRESSKHATNSGSWGGTNTRRINEYDWEDLERDMQTKSFDDTPNPRDGNGLCKAG